MKLEIPECINKPVESALMNVTDKPTKEIGDIINDLLMLIFGKVHFSAEKRRIKYKYALEQYTKSCEEKIKAIPEDRLVEPDLQIISAALEDSKYCVENETLREMFANLISGSLDADKKSSVRPCFSNLIKQMSSREAGIFAAFKPNTAFPMVEYRIPLGNAEYKMLVTNVLMATNEKLNYDSLYQRIIDLSSLENLGLIVSTFDRQIEEEKYMYYLHNSVYDELQRDMMRIKSTVVIKKGIIYLTPLGIEMWNVCCKDSSLPIIDGVPASFL